MQIFPLLDEQQIPHDVVLDNGHEQQQPQAGSQSVGTAKHAHSYGPAAAAAAAVTPHVSSLDSHHPHHSTSATAAAASAGAHPQHHPHQQQQQQHHSNGHATGGTLHRTNSVSSLYSKSISQSARDQQYFLNMDELHSKDHTYTSKLVLFTTNAIARLVKQQYFPVAALALTGLTKLSAKNTADVAVDSRVQAIRSDQIAGITIPLVRRMSNFIVAANALSVGSEEALLSEIKQDLNRNVWSKLMSYGEVLGANFKKGGDSFGQMSKLFSESVLQSQSSVRSPQQLSSPSSTRRLPRDNRDNHSYKVSAQVSQSLDAVQGLRDGRDGNSLRRRGSHNSGRRQEDPHSPVPVPVSDSAVATAGTAIDKDGQEAAETTTSVVTEQPAKPVNASDVVDTSLPSQAQPSPSSLLTASASVTGLGGLLRGLSLGSPKHSSHSPGPSFLGSELIQKAVSAVKSTLDPEPNHDATTAAVAAAAVQHGSNHRQRKRSVSSIRRMTQLKQNSEVEYSKSKTIAANTVSQLLLDWLETRQDPLFGFSFISKLKDIWKSFGKLTGTSCSLLCLSDYT
jgi:hypothetical protein